MFWELYHNAAPHSDCLFAFKPLSVLRMEGGEKETYHNSLSVSRILYRLSLSQLQTSNPLRPTAHSQSLFVGELPYS